MAQIQFSTLWSWPTLNVLTFLFANISQTVRDRAKINTVSTWDVEYMPSNGHIANVVLHDLEINFKVKVFKWPFWQVKARKHKNYYCHQIGSQIFIIKWRQYECCGLQHDVDLHLQDDTFVNVSISKTVRSTEKCSSMSFIEIDIRHRMGSLRLLYFVTLT